MNITKTLISKFRTEDGSEIILIKDLSKDGMVEITIDDHYEGRVSIVIPLAVLNELIKEIYE